MAKENVKCPYGCELQSETKIICALISGKNVPCEDRDRTDCALKDILLNLQAIEQELRELAERLERTEEDLKGECTRCAATEQLDEQIEALQAKNEVLKEENEDLKEKYTQLNNDFNSLAKEIEDEYCDYYITNYKEKLEKYKEALDEIGEFCSCYRENPVVGKAYDKILSIIEQADLRRVEPTEGSEPDNVRAIVDGNEVKSTACPRESKSKTAKGEE